MALLAIRTTLKPDIGASSADLVYGEGLAVPGELLPDVIFQEEDLTQQRKRMLGNLRVEVERLQPKPTSAHRHPQTHLPDDLQNSTHVFVRRGGHGHPPLTTPYVGPYKVDSRTATGFNVHLPGRGIDEVALARLKPAYIDHEDDQPDGEDSQTPPPQSPPSTPAQQPPPSPPAQQPPPAKQRASQNRRRGVPHIADFNRRRPSENRPFKKEPSAEVSQDPYDGHTPADPNLAPCQCEIPDDPQAPCNMPNQPAPLPLAITPHPRPVQASDQRQLIRSRTSMRQNDPPSPPVAARPGTDPEDNPTPLPQTITPHPRQLQSSDVNKRKARPNYGPSLSAIIKSHLGI